MRWIFVSEKRPEGWKLCRVGNKRFPAMIATNVIADVAGKTYKPSEIEYFDESLPASAEEEAERLYPCTSPIGSYDRSLAETKKEAHITCARMYTGELSRLKTLFKEFWDSNVAEPCKRQGASDELIEKHWQQYKAKHNL